MGRGTCAGPRGRGPRGRAGPRRGGPARGGGHRLTLLIREGPAVELTVATRILAQHGSLAPGGRVAALVGSEVVYLAGRGTSAATVTPYDLCALRLGDGTVLAGDPPDDADRYLAALRTPGRGAVAATREGDVAATDVPRLIERVCGASWDDVVALARAAGALVGAYPADVG